MKEIMKEKILVFTAIVFWLAFIILAIWSHDKTAIILQLFNTIIVSFFWMMVFFHNQDTS